MIYNNNISGIASVNASANIFQWNQIYSNNAGVQYNNSSDIISLNTITNNTYGVVYLSGDTTRYCRNNMVPNQRYALSNASAMLSRITNNWWGSTLATNIRKKMFGQNSFTNFTPYRLFGPFDITPYADTDPAAESLPAYTLACKPDNRQSQME